MLSGRRKSRSPYHRNSEQKKKSTHQHRSSRNPHNRNETSCRRGIPLAWQRAVLYSGSAIFHPARSQERGEYPCGQKTIALSVEDGLLTPYLRRGGNHDGRLHQRKQKKKKKKTVRQHTGRTDTTKTGHPVNIAERPSLCAPNHKLAAQNLVEAQAKEPETRSEASKNPCGQNPHSFRRGGTTLTPFF